jgi:predicted RNA-binding protein with PUA-like domain
MIHKLKTLTIYFNEVWNGNKNFELRRDDRKFNIGDTLILYDSNGIKLLGRYASFKITYILRDCKKYGLQEGYAILGLKPL